MRRVTRRLAAVWRAHRVYGTCNADDVVLVLAVLGVLLAAVWALVVLGP